MFEHAYRSLVEGRRNQLNRAASWFAVYTCAAARLGGALNKEDHRLDRRAGDRFAGAARFR